MSVIRSFTPRPFNADAYLEDPEAYVKHYQSQTGKYKPHSLSGEEEALFDKARATEHRSLSPQLLPSLEKDGFEFSFAPRVRKSNQASTSTSKALSQALPSTVPSLTHERDTFPPGFFVRNSQGRYSQVQKDAAFTIAKNFVQENLVDNPKLVLSDVANHVAHRTLINPTTFSTWVKKHSSNYEKLGLPIPLSR